MTSDRMSKTGRTRSLVEGREHNVTKREAYNLLVDLTGRITLVTGQNGQHGLTRGDHQKVVEALNLLNPENPDAVEGTERDTEEAV